MTAIITAALPFLFSLFEWIFKKAKVSDEQKANFLAFVEAHRKLGNCSVKQAEEVEKQLDELEAKK